MSEKVPTLHAPHGTEIVPKPRFKPKQEDKDGNSAVQY